MTIEQQEILVFCQLCSFHMHVKAFNYRYFHQKLYECKFHSSEIIVDEDNQAIPFDSALKLSTMAKAFFKLDQSNYEECE